MAKKNLWIFNHYAITPDMPGGSRHYDLARELVDKGYDVTIFASSFHHKKLVELKLKDEEKWKVYGKIFELSLKHQVPDIEFFRQLFHEGVCFSFGSDSHTIGELENAKGNRFWEEITAGYGSNICVFMGTDSKIL